MKLLLHLCDGIDALDPAMFYFGVAVTGAAVLLFGVWQKLRKG